MSFAALGVNVMISGPGDTSTEVDVVRTAVAKWNSSHSEDMGVVFIAKHFTTETVPLYKKGVDGQSVINDQITDMSDVVIALFKHRLGTPTPRNEFSGTVEEADLREIDSPVHFFFWAGSTLPAVLAQDGKPRDEWIRLVQFRERFHANSSGLYGSFISDEDLAGQVERALWLDARELREDRMTTKSVVPASSAPPAVSLSVDVVGSVWHLPQVEDLVEVFIEGEVKEYRDRFQAQSSGVRSLAEMMNRPLTRQLSGVEVEEWAAVARSKVGGFDELVASSAALPLNVLVSSDGLIEALEIEIVFNNVIGVDPDNKSWEDLWTPLSPPVTNDILLSPRVGLLSSLPPARLSHPAHGFSWEPHSNGGVVATLRIGEIRKRLKPNVFDDAVVLWLPHTAVPNGEVEYSWRATARRPDVEWSGSGIMVVEPGDSWKRLQSWMGID